MAFNLYKIPKHKHHNNNYYNQCQTQSQTQSQSQNSGSSENVLLQYSLSTSSSSQDPTKYGFLLSNCNINNTFGFNYNNIIINNAPSQTYYLVIQKTVTGSSFNYNSNTNASYLIASRIA